MTLLQFGALAALSLAALGVELYLMGPHSLRPARVARLCPCATATAIA